MELIKSFSFYGLKVSIFSIQQLKETIIHCIKNNDKKVKLEIKNMIDDFKQEFIIK